LRAAGSLLPIPDPEIVRLSGPAFDAGNNNKLIETIWGHRIMLFIAEKLAGKNPELRDEIWLVVGPQTVEGSTLLPNGQTVPNGVLVPTNAGVGGYAPEWAPWTAATAVLATVTAHEIGHLAQQRHVNLCNAGGDAPSSLPNNGNVGTIGWDMWNNVPVRGAIDLMSYCWAQAWISPERWRRIFLQIGP
jgi:hypothetical protein